MTDLAEQPAQRSNTTLWLLLLTFAVPMLGAYIYFFFADDYSLGNHGELMQPVVQIEDLVLLDDSGRALSRDELTHHWKMLYIAGQNCDSQCQETIYHMRQINTALGKNASRFKRMIIHVEPMSAEFSQLISKEHPAALHSYGTMQKLQEVLVQDANGPVSNTIYVMDPLGNIMMRFSYGMSPKLILKDLKRLLKISRIG